jgi:hypothetical protein
LYLDRFLEQEDFKMNDRQLSAKGRQPFFLHALCQAEITESAAVSLPYSSRKARKDSARLAPARDSSDRPGPRHHGDAQVFRVAFDRARQTLSKTLPDSEKAKNKE